VVFHHLLHLACHKSRLDQFLLHHLCQLKISLWEMLIQETKNSNKHRNQEELMLIQIKISNHLS
jgi:hypothetical protein